MNTVLSQKTRALDAAVWPLGRPENAYEIPMWQDICREWVVERMQPTNVTYLIDELLNATDGSNPETTAHDIRQAILAAADWEEQAVELGWRRCDDLIEALTAGAEGSDALLLKLLCLIAYGYADTTDYEDDEDYAFYWIRRDPVWEGNIVETKHVLRDWADMTDTYIAHRAAGDGRVKKVTGEDVEYRLGWCRPMKGGGLSFSESGELMRSRYPGVDSVEELPAGEFLPLSRLIENCRHAVTAWVISEWLEPHGFVNFDQQDWSSETTWQALGENEGVEEKITEPEVAHWYIVNEFAAESLREVGAVVSELPGSSDGLFGRTESGQVLHFDGDVQRAMIHSDHLDRIPPLGALHTSEKLPRIKFTLGGEEFPFRIYGYSEHRPDRELDGVLLDPHYRENGWCVIWGPSFESESEGLVRMFKLSPVTPEGHPEPAYHEG
jgi:hypothetical protein